MIRNFLKIAVRTFWNEKLYSAINIAGLVIGLSSALLIIQFINDELSYDNFHHNAERIYRVGHEIKLGTGTKMIASSPQRLAAALQTDFPELEHVTHFNELYSGEVFGNGKKFREEKIAFIDPTFFDVFKFEFVEGENSKKDHSIPNTVIISENVRRRYFGTETAVGKILKIEEPYGFSDMELTVSGVIENMPTNSHFHLDFLVSMASGQTYFPEVLFTEWGWDSHYTYVMLPHGVSQKDFDKRLLAFSKKHVEGEWLVRFFSQPLTSIHLRSNINSEIEPNGDIQYLYIFGAIAIILVSLASVNYMNLSTARAMKRIKEIAIRKSLGAYRHHLIGQFIGESFFLVLIAMILGGVIAEFSIPFFGQLSGKAFTSNILSQPVLLISYFALAVHLGLISGAYPGFYISSFRPVAILKGDMASSQGSHLWIRKVLVVFQFTLSASLIIGVLVAYEQWDFLQSKKLGISTDKILVIHGTPNVLNHFEAFKNELKKNKDIVAISSAGRKIGFDINSNRKYRIHDGNQNYNSARLSFIEVDFDFMPMYRVELLTGRHFSKDHSTDTIGTLILNEAAMHALGYSNPDDLLDQVIAGGNDASSKSKIVGIVRDFHFESLYNKIKPMAFSLVPDQGLSRISVKTTGENYSSVVKFIDSTWNTFENNRGIRYSDLDIQLQETYKSEQRFFLVFTIFSILALVTACLGIFGLASFVATQRRKEIGIRKILGASVTNLTYLMNSEFLKLVLLANIIAWPLAYLSLTSWLQHFEYRIPFYWWIFLASTACTLLISLATVGIQSFKAALSNPVDTLKEN